ncbi:hypothetical protein KBD20_04030 [Candidatus Saccharibacteria bacterium]|nr:hypothetical protein [Candidatus Saccharibacteria bacterium]
MATQLQRIKALYAEGVINKSEYDGLVTRERRVRGGLNLVRTKLGENFDDFRARAYDVAKCRGKQHWWDTYSYELPYRPVGAVFTESERCERCHKIRITLINALGRTDRHKYIDPPGFKLEGVRTTKGDWKELLRYFELGLQLDALEEEGESAPIVHMSDRRTA